MSGAYANLAVAEGAEGPNARPQRYTSVFGYPTVIFAVVAVVVRRSHFCPTSVSQNGQRGKVSLLKNFPHFLQT